MNIFDAINNVALAFITNLRGPQLIIIILVVLVLFGSKQLPNIARSFGKAIREFRKSASTIEDDFKKAMNDDETEAKVASTSKSDDDKQMKKSA